MKVYVVYQENGFGGSAPQHDAKLPVIRSVCPKCKGKGWYFVNEWIGTLQGRKDCSCKGKLPS